jgi:SAM-dependent methyltransferase
VGRRHPTRTTELRAEPVVTDYDVRLVDLYDDDNPDGPDHDFYRALADRRGAARVLDLGCGTGLLTVTFARPDRSVVGVDPSATMLAYAKRRPDGDAVHWVLGDSRSIPDQRFDYAVMTGNAAQHIPDAHFDRTLRDLRRALRPGAVLAFECRNPAARAWERWASNTATSRQTLHGELREWTAAEEVAPGRVKDTFHNLFESTGEEVIETTTLRFRDCHTITDQLGVAGFEVESVYGDWQEHPFVPSSPLMVFVARAARPG